MTKLRYGMVVVAALFGCVAACGGRIEGADIEFDYTVQNVPGGLLAFETVTVTEQDVSSHHASLTSVTLEVVSPSGTTLAFLSDLQASASSGGATTQLVTLTTVPHSTTAPLDIVFHGDLQPFFPDGHTIRVRWKGHLAPSFGPLPSGGVTVRCRIGISS
jgi:hypothetical protein